MNAVGGGYFTRCAECCSMFRRDVGRVVHTARSLSERSRIRERVYLERSLFLEAPKLASYGRHVPEGSIDDLCSVYGTKRCAIQLVNSEVQKVKVRFILNHQVAFGEHMALLGSTECAGSWENRVMMHWTDTGWVVDVEADPGETIEYKYIVVTKDGNVVWEHGTDRVVVVPEDFSNYYQIVSHWSATSEAVEFEVIDESEAAEDGGTKGEQELSDGTGEVIDETQTSADEETEAEKELTVKAIESGSIEGTHAPEDEVTGPTQVEPEENVKVSSNLQKIEHSDTTGIEITSKLVVESGQNSAERWGLMSVFILLLITGGLVGLLNSSSVGKPPWTFLSGFPSATSQTEEGP